MSFAFHKYEGLGNDFILVESPHAWDVTTAHARQLCDRHFGIGGDGVLLLFPPGTSQADARMKVINSDGSVPEMCGNGVRCVALHWAREHGMQSGTVRVDTDAGLRTCAVENASGDAMVTVEMGVVKVGETRTVEVDGANLVLTLADLGNPHAVILGVFDRVTAERFGPRISTHPEFPDGINVEFAKLNGRGIDLVVCERGAGFTLACGTGACAAAAVACASNAVSFDAPIGVYLPGGLLEVTVHRDWRVTLRGPARHVFSGSASS